MTRADLDEMDRHVGFLKAPNTSPTDRAFAGMSLHAALVEHAEDVLRLARMGLAAEDARAPGGITASPVLSVDATLSWRGRGE